jgi:sugar-specific transcriptional regulator TrmB
MEVGEILKEIGLTEDESKVYLALLKLGSNLASKISEETKLNRSFVYQILDKLIEKGFVGYVIKENRRYYSPINPNKLLHLLKEREERLKSILPALIKFSEPLEKKSSVEILEGKEGIKTILKDIIKVKKEWLAFGSSGKAPEILPYYIEPWEKERQKEKIILRAILDSSEQAKKRGKELSKIKFTEIRYIKDKFDMPSSIWIYGDRVVIIMWNKEHSFAIRTISKDIVKSYKNYFNVMWEIAK